MTDQFNRDWIIANALQEIPNYADGELTLRALYYRLVGRGMTNSLRHYKRVVAAMTKARRDGIVSYYTFSDHDREVIGSTDWQATDLDDEVEKAKHQIGLWMNSYSKNRWETQEVYLELWIEKKALQGVFAPVCSDHDVALSPCKGYPSLTFLNEAADRFIAARGEGKRPKIIYFGDYDPSGEDIPRSLQENLQNDFGIYVEVDRIALMERQVREWRLPPAPAKRTDSRTRHWDGIGQVELDAVDPHDLKALAEKAILANFDEDLYDELLELQEQEREQYRDTLKDYVKTL